MCAGSAPSRRSVAFVFWQAGPGSLFRRSCRDAGRRLSVSCALVDRAPPMFTLLEAQKTALTAIIFVATFFAVLTVGRFLKRRAGVRLGVPFHLFCLTLAFYAAIFFYG